MSHVDTASFLDPVDAVAAAGQVQGYTHRRSPSEGFSSHSMMSAHVPRETTLDQDPHLGSERLTAAGGFEGGLEAYLAAP